MRTPPSVGEVTRLLAASESTDTHPGLPLDRLFALVYDDLHRRAHRQHERWAGARTLNTTALVHEAYEKLAGAEGVRFESRAHFLAVAARAMRQVLLDYAKGQRALKRGGDHAHITLGDHAGGAEPSYDHLLTLDAALERLHAFNPEGAEVVAYRFYGGLSVEETATALGISEPTVKRRWRTARAWLYRELDAEASPPEPERGPVQTAPPRLRIPA